MNELLGELLEKREEEIQVEKAQLAKVEAKNSSRYISVKVRRVLQAEHGTKCSIHNCDKPSQEIHHTQRFALAKTHDPRYMAPLCKAHHEIAGAIDIKAQKYKWKTVNSTISKPD